MNQNYVAQEKKKNKHIFLQEIPLQFSSYEVLPVHSHQMQSRINVETSGEQSSSSMTVSIFGALAEILSQTTESLSFLTSTTTERSTTTTTTTTTTPAPTTTTTTLAPQAKVSVVAQNTNEFVNSISYTDKPKNYKNGLLENEEVHLKRDLSYKNLTKTNFDNVVNMTNTIFDLTKTNSQTNLNLNSTIMPTVLSLTTEATITQNHSIIQTDSSSFSTTIDQSFSFNITDSIPTTTVDEVDNQSITFSTTFIPSTTIPSTTVNFPSTTFPSITTTFPSTTTTTSTTNKPQTEIHTQTQLPTTSSLYPVYIPSTPIPYEKQIKTTTQQPLVTTETTTTAARFTNRIPILPIGTESSTRAPRKHDYIIYGILSNNSVVEKTPNDNYYGTTTERQSRNLLYGSTESNLIVYGIYPNNTVVRKYPNGTIVQEKQLNENIKLSNYSPENIITELQKQSLKNQQKQQLNENETVGVDNYSSSITLQKTTNSGVTVFNRHFYFYLKFVMHA